jgi:hypothetical protein
MKIVFSRGKLKTDGTEGRNMYLPDSLDIQNDPEQFDKCTHTHTPRQAARIPRSADSAR